MSLLASATSTAVYALTTALSDGYSNGGNSTMPAVEEPYNDGNYIVVSWLS